MLEFADALEKALRGARRLGAERVPLELAAGRVLAEEIVAGAPMPAFDYSAMDGYAVATADFEGSGPWELPVTGESKTGAVAPDLERGTACRIFTGAPMPSGADAVVMQERVAREGDRAGFSEAPPAGDNVRRAGEDLEQGAVGLTEGTRLGPFQLGLAAALDRAQLLVATRPRVTVLSTGDELRPPGSRDRPGTIPESNGPAVAALARAAGAEPRLAALVGDDERATRLAVGEALVTSDVVVTIGGVSVGEYDLVKPALEAAGASLDFWKVRIKPGKPLVLGHAGGTRILGLPGNPVSALVTFTLFGVPLLRMLQGDRDPLPRRRTARLAAPIRQKPGRLGFYRAVLDGDRVLPHTGQSSGSTVSLARADVLVVIPEDSDGAAEGDAVEVVVLGGL